MKNALKITFDKSAREVILNALGKSTDTEGYVVEASNPTQRVLAQNGQEMLVGEFAGVRKGSQVFIKGDIASLIKLTDDLAAKKHK